jgi:ankyrin repeat protein
MKKSVNKELLDSIYSGQIELVKEALNSGAEINSSYDYEDLPLVSAVRYKQMEIAELLIKSGADVNKRKTYSALAHSIINEDVEMVRLLLDKGANPNSYLHQASLLTHACYKYNKELDKYIPLSDLGYSIVEILLAAGATTNAQRGDDPPSPLVKPIRVNDLRTVKLLIDHGAKLTTVPVMVSANFCAIYGYYEMLKLLLENGWKPNPKKSNDNRLASPLNYAIKNRHTEIVKLLIEYKANPNYIPNYCPNDSDQNLIRYESLHPISLAIKSQSHDILRLLLDSKSNPDGDIEGIGEDLDLAPIIMAIINRDLVAVNELMPYIDINKIFDFPFSFRMDYHISRETGTILDLAEVIGNEDITKSLIAQGAKKSASL